MYFYLIFNEKSRGRWQQRLRLLALYGEGAIDDGGINNNNKAHLKVIFLLKKT